MKNNKLRSKRLQQYKRNKRIPRYDLANKPVASGYQMGDYFNPGISSVTPGESIDPETQTIKQNILPNALSQASPYVTLLKDTFKSATKTAIPSAFASTTAGITSPIATSTLGGVNAAASNLMSDITGNFAKSTANTLSNATQTMTKAGLNTGTAAGNIGSSAGKSILGSASTALSALGTAYGLYNTIGGFAGMKNNVTSASDLLNRSSKFNQSVNGVQYQGYGGIDTNAETKYFNAKEKSSQISNAVNAAGLGASVGSFLGPLGTGIGALIGGIGGFFGSLFGRRKRRNELRKRIRNVSEMQSNYNDQQFAQASSQGLRNQFAENTHEGSSIYNCGKDGGIKSKYDNGKMSQQTWTPDGQQYAPVNSLVGKGESIIDYTEGKASYVDKGTKRVDNQPSVAQDGDRIVIAGNDKDWSNGVSFADQIAPFTKRLEHLNKTAKSVQNNKYSNEQTKQLNLQQIDKSKADILQEMKRITDRQEYQHRITNAVPNARYAHGKIDWNKIGSVAKDALNMAGELSPYIVGMSYPSKQYNMYKNMTPHADNSYIANPNAERALNILAGMRFDPTSQINSVKDAYRQGLYNINQSGGLTQGQKMAMQVAQNTGYAKNLADVYSQANDINNKYRAAYAQAALSEGQNAASRQQQALATQQENYRQAVARRLLGMESAQKGKLNILNTIAKHIYDTRQSNRALDYNNKMLDLYNRQLDIDKIGAMNSIQNRYSIPYGNYLTPYGNYQNLFNINDDLFRRVMIDSPSKPK